MIAFDAVQAEIPARATSDDLREHCTREALRIWTSYAKDHPAAPGAALMPLLLEDYRVDADLLFVGMNPSFSPEAVERILHRDPGRQARSQHLLRMGHGM
jgi:hypothetical protein